MSDILVADTQQIEPNPTESLDDVRGPGSNRMPQGMAQRGQPKNPAIQAMRQLDFVTGITL